MAERLRENVAALVTTITTVMVAGLLVATHAAAGTPTRASWAVAANRDCAAANARIRALPKETTLRRIIADTRSTLAISKRLTRQLSVIPRPQRERRLIGKLVMGSRSGNSIVENQLLPALTSGHLSRAQKLAAELKPLNTKLNRIARALDARICAENPKPSG